MLSQSPINSGDIPRRSGNKTRMYLDFLRSQSPINSGDIPRTGASCCLLCSQSLNPLLIAGTFRVQLGETRLGRRTNRLNPLLIAGTFRVLIPEEKFNSGKRVVSIPY